MKKSEIKRDWYVVDASETPLGRMSTKIAMCLMGKNKPEYTPHMDMGDFVIVINAGKVKLTGKKLDDKMYYSHSGYPGSIKEKTAKEMIEKKPEDVIIKSVKGMLPKNKIAANMLKRLKVFKYDEHKHEAQRPKKLQ
jgi:large subunit ribosomal protein L13